MFFDGRHKKVQEEEHEEMDDKDEHKLVQKQVLYIPSKL